MNSSPRESPATYSNKRNPNQSSAFPIIFACISHFSSLFQLWCFRGADIQGGRVADFGSHALLHEGTELALIVNLDDLLRPIGRVGDVELHLDGSARSRRRARFVDRSRRFRSSGIRSSWDFFGGVARFPCVGG